MKITRTINVITLTLILFLAGCFGLSDAAEAADEHEHTPNAAPVLHAELMYQNQPDSSFSYAASCTSIDCNITSYHAAVDPDGDVLQMGYDYDLDGTIDNLLTSPRGFTEHQIPIADMFKNEVSSVQNTELSDCIDDSITATTTSLVTNELMTSIALIAVDSKGASSAVLLHVNNLFSSEEILVSVVNQTCPDYIFSQRDATGSMGETTNDQLVHVRMTYGEPLPMALLRVSIVVDGGSTLICGATDGTRAVEGDCAYLEDNGNYWDVPEEITIMENGQDLCNGRNGGCDVEVTLTKLGVGNEDDEVIATISSFADPTCSGCGTYTFDDRDATGSMGETTDDKLVHVHLTSGEPINWATLRVSIVVDGGNTQICGATNGFSAAEGDCAYLTDGSTTWDVVEEITIMENGQDLCDGTDGGCDVQVILTKIGVGNEPDEMIGIVTAFADASDADSFADPTCSGCDSYTFDDRDATGSMGETTDDKLVHVQLTSGEPINWALLKVAIIVDGGSTLICGATDGSAAAEGDCAFMTDGSTTWDVAEEITIMENGQDLCDGTDGGCAVQVILTQIGVGNESDEIIGVVSSFADSSA